MAITVRIPTPLQKLTDGKSEVACSAKNVQELVDILEKEFPGMKERLSEGGKIRRFINIFVNDEDIRFLDKENTALKDGDTISIVPAIAGGHSAGMLPVEGGPGAKGRGGSACRGGAQKLPGERQGFDR